MTLFSDLPRPKNGGLLHGTYPYCPYMGVPAPRGKTAVVSLWFDVAHLTDSLLEAIKVCQVGNGGQEIVHWTSVKGKNEYL